MAITGNGNGSPSNPGEAVQVELKQSDPAQDKRATLEIITHVFIVSLVLISATIALLVSKLDTTTISTVYGAAIGYATGLTARRRN